ncbi:MAG TPA: hypothetical protein VIW21_10565 [Chthoniobacterales bacterium]
MAATRSDPLAGWIGVFAVLAFAPLPADASSRHAATTPTPTHRQTVISAVTATSITVDTETVADKGGKVLDKTSRTYIVTRFTEITVNGQRATLADLKPKMKVSVTAGTDPAQAARIVANG